jgi:GNAT superfamily N-acetyltransferase
MKNLTYTQIDGTASYEDMMACAELMAERLWNADVDTRAEAMMARWSDHIFILLKDETNSPVAYYSGEIRNHTTLELFDLFVLPQKRRLGIATQALHHARRTYRKYNCDRIEFAVGTQDSELYKIAYEALYAFEKAPDDSLVAIS